jgi:hypothetical protein
MAWSVKYTERFRYAHATPLSLSSQAGALPSYQNTHMAWSVKYTERFRYAPVIPSSLLLVGRGFFTISASLAVNNNVENLGF